MLNVKINDRYHYNIGSVPFHETVLPLHFVLMQLSKGGIKLSPFSLQVSDGSTVKHITSSCLANPS